MNRLFRRAVCLILGHRYYLIRDLSPFSKLLGCHRCRRRFGMNDDARVLAPWESVESFYENRALGWARIADESPPWGMACWVILAEDSHLTDPWGPVRFAIWGVDGRDRWTVLTPQAVTLHIMPSSLTDWWQRAGCPSLPPTSSPA